MIQGRFTLTAAALCMAAAAIFSAAPANAAVPAPAPSPAAASPSVSAAVVTAAAFDQVPAVPRTTPVVVLPAYMLIGPTTSGVHPNSIAGSYYYVCVSASGATRTLTVGQATTQCKGYNSIQQWLDSGQFVKTLQLSTSGQTVHTKFNGTPDCYVALAAGAVAVLTIADSWAWYSTAAMSGYGLHACISE